MQGYFRGTYVVCVLITLSHTESLSWFFLNIYAFCEYFSRGLCILSIHYVLYVIYIFMSSTV